MLAQPGAPGHESACGHHQVQQAAQRGVEQHEARDRQQGEASGAQRQVYLLLQRQLAGQSRHR